MCRSLFHRTLLEVAPIVASFDWLRTNHPKIAEKMEHLHHYAPALAIAGPALSSLHQSSPGAVCGADQSLPDLVPP
ncbi:MAG: hypothetical protein IPJ47_22885 [Anaerolineales bacterium]|nr:hypothetical protein [Anaerolineales bacterium]